MENLNKVQLTGEIQSEIRENHEWKSEKFYMFELGVKRKSGVIDKARIMVSERLIDLNNLMLGTVINIEGEIRTYNQHDEQNRSHLYVYIFSNAIKVIDQDDYYPTNMVELEGFLIKQPIFRTTPLGREICDAIIAVNRRFKRTSYIPCIFWSRNARYLSKHDAGTLIRLKGRLQSREYQKREDIGSDHYRTAYEISSYWMTVLGDSETTEK